MKVPFKTGEVLNAGAVNYVVKTVDVAGNEKGAWVKATLERAMSPNTVPPEPGGWIRRGPGMFHITNVVVREQAHDWPMVTVTIEGQVDGLKVAMPPKTSPGFEHLMKIFKDDVKSGKWNSTQPKPLVPPSTSEMKLWTMGPTGKPISGVKIGTIVADEIDTFPALQVPQKLTKKPPKQAPPPKSEMEKKLEKKVEPLRMGQPSGRKIFKNK